MRKYLKSLNSKLSTLNPLKSLNSKLLTLNFLLFSLPSVAQPGFFGPRETGLTADGDSLFVLNSGPAAITVNASKGGKIMSLKYHDKEVLSQSRFPESFGSTFWTSPQKEWNWPPVPEFDKRAYRILSHDDASLFIASPVSERLGLSVAKTFVTGTADGTFTVTYSIKNEGGEARSVAPWEITRVPNADGLIFFAPTDSIWPAGLMTFETAHGAAWYHTDEAQQNRKVNADACGWLAYCADGLLLFKTFPDLKASEPAPGEAEVQVYVNRGKSYIELESQGAYTCLQPGEQLSWTVNWHLLPANTDPVPSSSLLDTVNSLLKH